MKKTLIAVAALAATAAFAQNVTITGTFDATFRNSRANPTNGSEPVKGNVLGKDGIGTSGFTLAGNEDLGGGLKATFLYELNFNPADTGTNDSSTATGSQLSTGQAFVGLEGGFGAMRLGAPNQPTGIIQSTRGMSFGTKDGGRAALITNLMGASQTRQDSSIQYVSPNLQGLTINLTFIPATSTTAGSTNSQFTSAATNNTITNAGKQEARTDVAAFYSNGPIAAGVARYSEGAVSTATALTASAYRLTSFFASYDFGVAKVLVGGDTAKRDVAAVDQTAYNIGVEAPVAPGLTATVNYQHMNDKLAANNDSSMYGVGLQYALSKRTTVYARYIKQTVDNVASGTTFDSANRVLTGLRHNF